MVASIWTWIIVIAWCSVVRYFLCIRASNPNSFEIIMPFECFTYAYSTTIYTLHRSHCHFKRTVQSYLYFKMLSLDCIYDLSRAAAIATNQLGILDTFSRKNKIKMKKDREIERKRAKNEWHWRASQALISCHFWLHLISTKWISLEIKMIKKNRHTRKALYFIVRFTGNHWKYLNVHFFFLFVFSAILQVIQ